MGLLLLALVLVAVAFFANFLIYMAGGGPDCHEACSTTVDVTAALFTLLLIVAAGLLLALLVRGALWIWCRSAGNS